MLSGNTSDEARFSTMFVEFFTGRIDVTRYQALLKQTFGKDAGAVERRYPAGSVDPALAFSAVDADRIFACTPLRTTAALSLFTPTDAYEFADRTAPTYTPFFTTMPPGASHASELAYLFGLRSPAPYAGLSPTQLNSAQRHLGDWMIDY